MRRIEHRQRTLGLFRAMLVVSSFSPVLLVWALRGMPAAPSIRLGSWHLDGAWAAASGVSLAIMFPLTIVVVRWLRAAKERSYSTFTFERVEDDRAQVFDYLVAVLLSMFFVDVATERGLLAGLTGLLLVIWIFMFLGLHHVNLPLSFRGYRIYMGWPSNSGARTVPVVVLCRLGPPPTGQPLRLLRLDDHLFVEEMP
ncbi:MAG: hypothetical protein V4510_04775 [bacterium]